MKFEVSPTVKADAIGRIAADLAAIGARVLIEIPDNCRSGTLHAALETAGLQLRRAKEPGT